MYYFRVSFEDGTHLYQEGLTKRQAVLKYNKWVKEMSMQPIQEVTWSLM